MKPSAFDRHFSREEQAKLAAWLDGNPSVSVDDFRAMLAERGLEVGRSTAHVEKRKLGRLGERLRRTRDMRQQLVEMIGERDDSEQARANIEMLSSLYFEFTESVMDQEDGQLDTRQLMELGRMLNDMTSAQHRNQKFAEAVRRQAREEAEQAASRAAKDLGLSRSAFLEEYRRQLSVVPQAPEV